MSSHYLNYCWVIVNWSPRNKLQWNFNQTTKRLIHKNTSETIICEMAVILSRGRWVDVVTIFCNLWVGYKRYELNVGGVAPFVMNSSYITVTVSRCGLMQQSNMIPLQWCHNERDDVSNHQPHDCLLNRLFGRRSKKTSKLRVTGLCAGNSPMTGEFLAQRTINAENVSIWWRYHVILMWQSAERPHCWYRVYGMMRQMRRRPPAKLSPISKIYAMIWKRKQL